MAYRFLRFILVSACSFAFFVVFFLTAKSLISVLPDMTLFRQIEFDINAGSYSIPFFDVVFFAIGLFIFCYGIVILVDATSYNSSVIDPETKISRKLLTESYYADARHPMSGALILSVIGLFISVRTLYGLIFIALITIVQVISCYIEERCQLLIVFGNSYTEYKKKVRSLLMTFPMMIITGFAIGLFLIGLYFMGPRR